MPVPGEIKDAPERRNQAVEFTEAAFQDMIRQGADLVGDTPEKESREEEPEVKMEDEEETPQAVERIGDAKAPKEDSDTEEDSVERRLEKALTQIEELKSRVERPTQEVVDTRRSERPRPSKLVEVAPGAYLPENRDLWPIKLSDDMVKGLGLDPGERAEGQNQGVITQGLEKLGNLLVNEIVGNLVPSYVNQHLESRERTRATAEEEENVFFNAFADLKDKRDLMDAVERRMQAEVNDGRRHYSKRDDYLNDLARETRERLAAIRGQSYDEYLQTVGAQRRSGGGSQTRTVGRSRAVTTSGGRAGRRVGSPTDLDDMFEHGKG